MTEELKEQIHERVYNIKVPTLGFSRRDLFNIAMEYAEPREKRIAELEKENKTVSRKANEAIADKLLITSKYNEVLNDLNQQNDKLQKENAELKEDNSEWEKASDKWKSVYELTNNQLTKAKEIIKLLLHALKNEGSNYTFALENTHPALAEAEQFLKGEGCPDCFCGDCTKEDCGIKKLG